MIELVRTLRSYLKTLHPTVYFQSASAKSSYPYITFNILNSVHDGEGFEVFPIEVDGWDNSSNEDPTAIENLMAKINGKMDENGEPTGLNKKTLITEDFIVTFYIDSKLPPIPDDDKRIQRRKYTYQARVFERS